jgi:transcription termination factor Rho
LEINNNHPELLENSFSFSSVTPNFIEKRINKINVKKATGIDGISPKLLHFAKPKKGLIVGQKSLDLGPPAHLSVCFGKIFLSLKDACLPATSLKHLLK